MKDLFGKCVNLPTTDLWRAKSENSCKTNKKPNTSLRTIDLEFAGRLEVLDLHRVLGDVRRLRLRDLQTTVTFSTMSSIHVTPKVSHAETPDSTPLLSFIGLKLLQKFAPPQTGLKKRDSECNDTRAEMSSAKLVSLRVHIDHLRHNFGSVVSGPHLERVLAAVSDELVALGVEVRDLFSVLEPLDGLVGFVEFAREGDRLVLHTRDVLQRRLDRQRRL